LSPTPALALTFILVIAVGFLVWHATRANQARLAIRSRRVQIKNLWGETRKFGIRGIVLLIVVILLVAVTLRH
jgi:hypothetical protein